MTPAHTDSPLRRSEAGIFRDNAQNQLPQHNDDEEERREARRRTLNSTVSEDASIVEQSETLKKCLAIFHENKLSRDNAWSLSLIDTVSTLLARHHKSLNNFTVAGSSLEASSKVYGLRVDSVHTDVLRMSAGLNARKFRGNVEDEDDGVATGGEGSADPNSSANTGVDPEAKNEPKKRKAKRARNAVSTVTKNKETLNARLDTVPLQDPVFGKLNSVVGSINASNRLMNNMLHSVDGELRLRMTHKFWDSSNVDEDCDYTVPVPLDDTPDKELLPCDRLCNIERYEKQLLRPMMSGYIISDTPERSTSDKGLEDFTSRNNENPNNEDDAGCDGLFDIETQAGGGAGGDVSMAFDVNAECEPLPSLNSYAPILAVDEQDYDDFTAEEHNAIGNCRGLRRAPVVLEDLRPIDSTSNLEYSYRPVEKISQFWAGPSHWRFRRTRHRSSALGQTGNSQQVEPIGGRTLNNRNRRMHALQSKKRIRVQFTAPIHDAQFVMIDAKFKSRKTNFQKKWDQRKLRLPTDLQLHADTLVNFRFFAPALTSFNFNHNSEDDDDREILTPHLDDQHFNSDIDHDIAANDNIFGADGGILNGNGLPEMTAADAERIASFMEENQLNNTNNPANDTVLEIATDFEGAPRQVTKIIVPFAKRAKVIDMKNLKRTCAHLISQQLREDVVPESEIPQHPVQKTEKYAHGVASFQEVYKRLPPLLTPAMAEGLTPSIALYSVLHLANDFNYRLIQQEDLNDFYIRQILDE